MNLMSAHCFPSKTIGNRYVQRTVSKLLDYKINEREYRTVDISFLAGRRQEK